MGLYDDREKRRADDMEALWLGTLTGASTKIRDISKKLANAENAAGMSIGYHIITIADRDAQKKVLKTVIEELKHPENGVRFSAPDADVERAGLLANTYRQSWEKLANKISKERKEFFTREILSKTQSEAKKVLHEYAREAMEAKGKAFDEKIKPKKF